VSKNAELLDGVMLALREVSGTLGALPPIVNPEFGEEDAHEVIFVAGYLTAISELVLGLIDFLDSPDGIHPRGHPDLN
jgi:hypothetical protein